MTPGPFITVLTGYCGAAAGAAGAAGAAAAATVLLINKQRPEKCFGKGITSLHFRLTFINEFVTLSLDIVFTVPPLLYYCFN